MPKPRGKNYSLYLSADTDVRFQKVMEHIGKGVSETIALLIDIKANEIDEGVTRRQTMQMVQDSLARIEQRGLTNIEDELAQMKLMLSRLLEANHVNY